MVEGLFQSFPTQAYPLRLFLLRRRMQRWQARIRTGYQAHNFAAIQVTNRFPYALVALLLCYLLFVLPHENGGGEREGKRSLFRDQSVLDPPSPIPNLAVKQFSAHGTTAARLWESRPLRGILFTLFLLPLFLLSSFWLCQRD